MRLKCFNRLEETRKCITSPRSQRARCSSQITYSDSRRDRIPSSLAPGLGYLADNALGRPQSNNAHKARQSSRHGLHTTSSYLEDSSGPPQGKELFKDLVYHKHKTRPLDVPTVISTVRRMSGWRGHHEGSIALVPTMGALHDGHLALVRAAARNNENVVVSIYVNPTQFGVNEDLSKYPRTLDQDVKKLALFNQKLKEQGLKGRVKVIFAPSTNQMYPSLPPSSELEGAGSFVTITPIGTMAEGASRPVFFRGVATVCMKLFNIVKPEEAFFGRKDIQQLVLLRRLVKDFHLKVKLIDCPTSRDSNGLARSSRNIFLGRRRRNVASELVHPTLELVGKALVAGVSVEDAIEMGKSRINDVLEQQKLLPPTKRALFELDYLSLRSTAGFDDVTEISDQSQYYALCIAVKMLPLEEVLPKEDGADDNAGSKAVRLIDNEVIALSRARPIASSEEKQPSANHKAPELGIGQGYHILRYADRHV